MMTLVKKFPYNCEHVYQQEVICEPFPECVTNDLQSYIDDYHYALCSNAPNGSDAQNLDHYTIEGTRALWK